MTFLINFEREKVFHFQKQSPLKKKKVAHKILLKYTCNPTKKETPTQVCFCEFSEILLKTYLAENLRMAGSGFCTVLYVSLHNLFHQPEQ